MMKKSLAVLLALVCLFSILSSTALASSVGKKTTTRKLDDWYISDDGKYGIAIFGLDKHYDGSYYVTIYVKKMSSGQIVTSTDIELNLDEDEWNSTAAKYGYGKVRFELSDDHAIQEFESNGNKKYSFTIYVDIFLDSDDEPIFQTFSISFTAP